MSNDRRNTRSQPARGPGQRARNMEQEISQFRPRHTQTDETSELKRRTAQQLAELTKELDAKPTTFPFPESGSEADKVMHAYVHR